VSEIEIGPNGAASPSAAFAYLAVWMVVAVAAISGAIKMR
jgi:hypothetical protein